MTGGSIYAYSHGRLFFNRCIPLNPPFFDQSLCDAPEDLSGGSAWIGHLPFAFWIIKFLKPKIVVELGTHCGDSYFAFCQSAKKHSPSTRLYAVDTWQGDRHAGYFDTQIYDRVKEIHDSKYAACSTLLKKKFAEALLDIEDNSVDLLHIDGLHTYEAIKADFLGWRPKLSDRSIVLIHDTEVKRDDFGVYKYWQELRQKYQGFKFTHSSGLGVLLTGTNLTEETKQIQAIATSEELTNAFVNDFAILGKYYELSQEKERADAIVRNVVPYSKHLEKDIIALQDKIRELHDDLQAITSQLHDAKDELNSIYASKSWKYTSVLRNTRRQLTTFIWNLGRRGKYVSYLKTTAGGRLIYRLRTCLIKIQDRIEKQGDSLANIKVLNQFASARADVLFSQTHISCINNKLSTEQLPVIALTAVVYNSADWLNIFIKSLLEQSYPVEKIELVFVDNGSTDTSQQILHDAKSQHGKYFKRFKILSSHNDGYGAGHDKAIRACSPELILVTNVDLEFDKDAIVNIVNYASFDSEQTASWELRQKPYEHPKYYDPLSLEVSWSSHACILIRRSAYENVGGYDKKIFMYGEDVELSYRFRDNGYVLKYIPSAIAYHYTYEEENQIKPIQFSGSTRANALIRFRYGSNYDKFAAFLLQLLLFIKGAGFKGSRMVVLKNQYTIMRDLPNFWKRRTSNDKFPFRKFDYELPAPGGFYPLKKNSSTKPLVSILTRTYAGREALLRECIVSIINQTYPNIEHVIVEDGGDSMLPLINKVKDCYPNYQLSFQSLPPKGRSFAGNQCMHIAKGQYFLFLDDDDLLICDHIETLVNALMEDSSNEAAYSLAWEIQTSFRPDGSYFEHCYSIEKLFFQEFDREVLRHHNYIPIQSILFSRELYEKFGGLDEELQQLEDWNLWTRYGLKSRFKFVPKTTSMFRTPNDINERIARWAALKDTYQTAVEKQEQLP